MYTVLLPASYYHHTIPSTSEYTYPFAGNELSLYFCAQNSAPQDNLTSDCYLCPASPTNSAAQMHIVNPGKKVGKDGNVFRKYAGTFLFNHLTQTGTAKLMIFCIIHSSTTITEQDLPQMISRAHRVMSIKISNGSLSTCFSSFFTKIFPCSFMTSRKSFKIAKWNVGVIIFLRDRHLSPVL